MALEEECWRHDADLEQERGPAAAPSWGRPMGAQSGRNTTRRRGTGGGGGVVPGTEGRSALERAWSGVVLERKGYGSW